MFKFVILLTAVNGALGGVVLPGLPAELQGRIVGGQPSSIRSFPYQVSLQSAGYHICGGTIISEQIVVTAAHCMLDVNVTNLKVRAGSSQWYSGGVFVGVKDARVHERFSSTAMAVVNDIAILRLKSALVFSATIRPIDLATRSPESGTLGIVSGWGMTQFMSISAPTQLKYVEMPILSRRDCYRENYRFIPGIIRKGMICTYEVGKDSCQGDSGGPLVSGNKLVGVVSWGLGCALQSFPGVYTDVSLYRTWVLNTKAELEKTP